MSRYAGNVGFATQVDNGMGGFSDSIVPKKYRGMIKYLTVKQTDNTTLTPVLSTTTMIEIIASKYIRDNFLNIRWVEYMGVKFEARLINFQNNKLIITLGGRYAHDKTTTNVQSSQKSSND